MKSFPFLLLAMDFLTGCYTPETRMSLARPVPPHRVFTLPKQTDDLVNSAEIFIVRDMTWTKLHPEPGHVMLELDVFINTVYAARFLDYEMLYLRVPPGEYHLGALFTTPQYYRARRDQRYDFEAGQNYYFILVTDWQFLPWIKPVPTIPN
jgi:hypothetical protein